MDRRTLLKAGAGAAALDLAAPYLARGAAPLTLRWAHFAQEDHPANIAAKQFASRVAERSGGAVKINIFPNNVLGGPPEQAQQIKLGTIDMGLPTQGQLDKYDRAFAAVMLPFIFDNPQLVFRVLDGPAMEWLAPLAERQGFILLRNWDYGFRNVTNSVRPINAPDDVKGLKLRTPPELQIQASMEALGAVVQAIAFPELYLALSQRVVDGEENPIPVIYYNKFYEVQKHLAITRHIYNNMIHAVGVNSWKKLNADQQTIFREESASAGDLMRKLIADGEADQIKKLEDAGMTVTRPDLAPFRALMEPAYKRIADYAGAENVKKFRDIVEQARKT
ncbi:MAG: TRAP transporter substrate-binding protein [Methylobacteriaceae bacterium]|nr:TRAP transporter substrate-binding protein [Methylobacteriaceae bacterium]MBV9704935.1 TRAP transporter substrate-binding protein [Methylobacteriaceae bacterium]